MTGKYLFKRLVTVLLAALGVILFFDAVDSQAAIRIPAGRVIPVSRRYQPSAISLGISRKIPLGIDN